MAVSEKSLKNLRPPKKGEVRNKNGKPAGTLTAKTVINKWLSVRRKAFDSINNEYSILTVLDEITLAQILKAKKGDVASFSALLDRTEGKPPQKTDVTSDNEKIGNLSDAQFQKLLDAVINTPSGSGK